MDDPYLWLEEVRGGQALDWVGVQNARATAQLKSDPRYQTDYANLLRLLDAPDRIAFAGLDGKHVFNFWQDVCNPKGLWRRTTIADYERPDPTWETLLDIDALAAAEGENWVFKGASRTHAFGRALVQLSRGGGDAVVVREFDLTSKTFVKSGFVLAEAKTRIAWLNDDTVLCASDFGKGSLTASGYPRSVKLWQRGQSPAVARTIFTGLESDMLVAPRVYRRATGNTALIVRQIAFFEAEHFLVRGEGAVLKLPLPLFSEIQGFCHDQILFTLRQDWIRGDETFPKGALLGMALKPFVSMECLPVVRTLYVPGSRSMIDNVVAGRDVVYASIYENVTGSIYAFRPDGPLGLWSSTKLILPSKGSTHITSVNDFGPEAFFSFQSFLSPTTLYSDSKDKPRKIASLPARFDAAPCAITQYETVSKDGTTIPYFVVRRPGGDPAPTLLYAYGGFQISQTPWYWATAGKLWLEQGGVIAVASIRGGGEFGPAWHEAARATNRQKGFDDFAAVAADLSARHITTPKQLGIMGGSNGGLLVSAVMTQLPELIGAVVCQVPVIDLLRYTKIGAGPSWIAEYGDPDDPAVRPVLQRISPYHNVRAEGHYPPVFFTTATSDDRVTPVHARKMAAKMIAQGHQALFFENLDGGHAGAADHAQAAEMGAMAFVFLKRSLGLATTGIRREELV